MTRSGRSTKAAIDNKDVDGVGSAVLRGQMIALNTEVGRAFVADCARHTERLLSDVEVKNKWQLSDVEWEGFALNSQLLRALHAERDRRVASGDAAREAAQRHYAKAPDVLGSILTDTQISPRHRIEAAKELRQASGNNLEGDFGPTEKFVISINLGGDETVVLEKQVTGRNPSLDGGTK